MTDWGKGFRSADERELNTFFIPSIASLLNSVTLELIYACKTRWGIELVEIGEIEECEGIVGATRWVAHTKISINKVAIRKPPLHHSVSTKYVQYFSY